MKQHVKVVHEEVKDFKYEKCDYKGGQKKELDIHLNGVHNKVHHGPVTRVLHFVIFVLRLPLAS